MAFTEFQYKKNKIHSNNLLLEDYLSQQIETTSHGKMLCYSVQSSYNISFLKFL